jgi:prepilin-type N-terminal cleavage/methylation domain-containing protein
MIHTEKMTQGHKGMRKGISLVEMLVAIVLFGIIGTIGYTYYKNYYNTSFAGKQVRIYTLVEQATQLGNAYDLYLAKHGNTPVDINAMVQDKILTQIPAAMPGLTLTGWVLDANLSTVDSNNSGQSGFTYVMDANITNQTKLDYCNILNNVAYTGWELNNTDSEINGSSDFYRLGDSSGWGELEYFHCADSNHTTGAGFTAADHNFTFFFLK